jgi:DNA-binding response OmpR family regulator
VSDRAHILVADDEQNLCRILVARLSRDGHTAEAVHDGVQALERLNAGAYDLVLLDLRMPGRGGMEVLGALRRGHPPTAVMVMTAYDSPDTVRAALAAGADAYITKPFDLDWVAASVREVLQRRRATTGLPPPPAAPTPDASGA